MYIWCDIVFEAFIYHRGFFSRESLALQACFQAFILIKTISKSQYSLHRRFGDKSNSSAQIKYNLYKSTL